ncbi:hypothetical protein [Cohnella sp.]|uniref:hypothetical protein n=1 Tax=Cohnella sp. TaxID=1883426 RepID=UPI00356A47F0
MNDQHIVNTGAGIFGAFITFAFGYWSEALLMAVDIISGVSASIRKGSGFFR